ncbi:MAG: sugar transferase [Bacteroidetes bacterium]|nr:sugar transferase [Bacteroidota bacterium]
MEYVSKKPAQYIPFGALIIDIDNEEVSDFSYKKPHLVNYDKVRVLKIQPRPLNKWYNRLIKRVFDIILSLLVIILVLSWLIPILYLIKLVSGEKGLLFVQQRSGFKNRPFKIVKFRTMKKNGFSDTVPATRDDKRITKIGKFLRRTSIDEFPQFFNVLIGTMSVTGPRPHINQHNKEYKAIVNKFMIRHSVKPGITGYAQVNGHRGEIREIKDMKERIKFDIAYIENWSIWLDIKIVLLTVVKLLKGDSTAY